MGVTTVHRVGTRGERLAGATAVGRVAGGVAVDHVRGDREDRGRGHRVAVGVGLADVLHEDLDDVVGDLVHAVIVVAVLGEVALDLVVGHEAGLVADDLDLRVLDCGEGVGDDGEARDARGEPAVDVLVVQGHLQALVAVLVVHVVNDVEGVDVDLGQPLHHVAVLGHDVVVVEVVALDRTELRADLLAGLLVAAAVDGVEEALGEVGAGAEELHLLADAHGGHAARDRVVVAVVDAHEVVVLVLDGAGGDGDLGAVALEGLGQARGPEHREVGLGAGAHVLEGVEVAEGGLGDHGAAVDAHAADGLGDPLRVAGEQLVVLGGAGELDHAELHDEVVDDLLRLGLGDDAVSEVALGVDVQERGVAADGHGGAVLLLDRGEVAEVQPLHGLLERGGRAGDVEAVDLAKLRELLKGADLLSELLAVADGGLVHGLLGAGVLGLLLLDEAVDAVERDAAVVADDAAAAVGVGEAGDDVAVTARAHLGRVAVKDAGVVGLAVVRVDVHDLRVDLVAVLLARGHGHADAAVDHEGALERLLGLKAHDLLERLVDVAGGVGDDRGDEVGVHVEDAAGIALLLEEVHDLIPELGRVLGGTGEEGLVAVVRGVVLLDEVTDVDLVLPVATHKALPCFLTHCSRSFDVVVA